MSVLLVVLLAGGAYSLFSPQNWASDAVVSFTPRAEAAIAPDTVALVAQRYAVVVASDASADAIARDISGDLDSDALAGNITATLEAGTGNLRIQVTLPNRDQAVRAANSAAAFLVDQAADDDLITADLSSAATDRAAELTPPRLIQIAATVVAAIVLSLAAVAIADRVRSPRAGRAPARARAEEPASAPPAPARPSGDTPDESVVPDSPAQEDDPADRDAWSPLVGDDGRPPRRPLGAGAVVQAAPSARTGERRWVPPVGRTRRS
ncbi:hypothetical protein TEK04_15910 [Klenkia sp. LSe6-5]|uniref:Capsular polysaccharide biosynthesis protein n=1 Tax=Klenkia sesuvii TaxID=3103137 RepID=A0ABU8DYX3_9ACTN